MTKSPIAVAREALQIGQQTLPTYANKYSRKDYTLPQLFALVVLRKFFRTDYRGLVVILSQWAELREVLGLRKVPHYSTVWYAEQKLLKKGVTNAFWRLVASGPGPAA